MKGRVFRECTCRGSDGKLLGQRCSQLSRNPKHGSWSFAVDAPRLPGARRRTIHRRNFRTQRGAAAELKAVNDRFGARFKVDDKELTADFLPKWLTDKARTLKPTTIDGYTLHVEKYLIPALGAIPLSD
jgi:Phage integrase, N-terminal SAM-like domain